MQRWRDGTISISCKPVVGLWYVGMEGQLVKVWATEYRSGKLHKVVLEYAGGSKEFVNAGQWDQLDLNVNFYHPLDRGCSKDLQH